MGRIFRYEINPLYLKAVLEKMPTPDSEEAWEYFLKIHQSPKKIWKPQIKIPTIQISKIYLNGIIVALFTILFLYLVFFRGYSGMSEKKNENLIKKVSIPAKNNNTDNQNHNKNEESGKSLSLSNKNKSEDTMRRTTVKVIAPQDTLPNTAAVHSSEVLKNKIVPVIEENKNLQKSTPTSQITEIDTSGNKDVNPVLIKKKKRKKMRKEEAEILPTLGTEKITIQSGTSTEEDVKLRVE